MAEAEQSTEQAIKVRQVTQVHANWNEEERGRSGFVYLGSESVDNKPEFWIY